MKQITAHKTAYKKLKHHTRKVKQKFPKDYRFITEWPRIKRVLVSPWFWSGVPSSLLLILVIVASITLVTTVKQKQRQDRERAEIVAEIAYWQTVVKNYKDSRDAYFSLAVLEYRLKNMQKAREYIQKALSIDPNFEKGRQLERLLQ